MQTIHKKYIIFIDYGTLEGWRIWGETDTWEKAVALRDEARANGGHETIICEFVPLLVIDGRSKSYSTTD